MKLMPLQRNVLVRLKDMNGSVIVKPEGSNVKPYCEVLEVGPDCKFVKKDDKLVCLPDNLMGFEKDERGVVYLVPEVAFFGQYVADDKDIVPMS